VRSKVRQKGKKQPAGGKKRTQIIHRRKQDESWVEMRAGRIRQPRRGGEEVKRRSAREDHVLSTGAIRMPQRRKQRAPVPRRRLM
jgi:hypothetical protein